MLTTLICKKVFNLLMKIGLEVIGLPSIINSKMPPTIKTSLKTTRIISHKGIQALRPRARSEEHTSELQSLMRSSYAVFCLKKKKNTNKNNRIQHTRTEQ